MCESELKHSMQNTEIFFCLNCEDWVQNKDLVLESDWTLLDENGDPRQDV